MSGFDLAHIARLSRLHFTDEELKLYEAQVVGILKFVEELNQVQVKGITPTTHPFSLSNVFREDEPKPGVSIEEFLKHAPKAKGRFFEVPKVIEGKE